ncbi:retrovirus-related Pol polyprotein from transposon TNT 1-94, partial [Trifolium pratense]
MCAKANCSKRAKLDGSYGGSGVADDDGELKYNGKGYLQECDESEKSEEWFLDSGCSNHMTPHREWLTSFDASRKTSIKLADSRKLAAEGTYNIVIRGKTGNKVIVEDVFYVPKMNYNLMSIGQLVEKGFSVTIEGNSLNLFDAKKNLVLKSTLS